jgi:4-hydroxybenzoyl-CoA reductase subunit alpha
LELGDKRVYVKANPDRGVPIATVIRAAYREGKGIVGRGSYTPGAMSASGWADPTREKFEGQQGATYTDGTTVVEVEVDLETGKVKVKNIVLAWDCGVAINPMAVEGQWEGATVSMLGETLFEKHEWDEKTGELVTDSFLDYKIPRSLDIPQITPIIVESSDPVGPYGAKEAGLCGSSGVGAAIANAICDAIGVRIKEAPITPEVILKALAQKSEIKKKI